MKNFKVKIILAMLFILVNLAFCGILLFYSPNDANNSRAGITELLKKKEITISDGALDTISDSFLTNATIENSISDREKLARAILGESANALPSASNIFMLNGKNVVFDGNAFHFESTENRDEYRFRGASDTNADSVTADVADKIGIDITGCVIESSKKNDDVTYTVTKLVDKKPVFNDSFTIVISDGYLKSLDGIWFAKLNDGNSRETKSIAGALIKFSNMPDVPRPAVITTLTPGYRIEDTSKQSSRLIAECKITLEDGTIYYVDM